MTPSTMESDKKHRSCSSFLGSCGQEVTNFYFLPGSPSFPLPPPPQKKRSSGWVLEARAAYWAPIPSVSIDPGRIASWKRFQESSAVQGSILSTTSSPLLPFAKFTAQRCVGSPSPEIVWRLWVELGKPRSERHGYFGARFAKLVML